MSEDIENTIEHCATGIISAIENIPIQDNKLDRVIELLEAIDYKLTSLDGVIDAINDLPG